MPRYTCSTAGVWPNLENVLYALLSKCNTFLYSPMLYFKFLVGSDLSFVFILFAFVDPGLDSSLVSFLLCPFFLLYNCIQMCPMLEGGKLSLLLCCRCLMPGNPPLPLTLSQSTSTYLPSATTIILLVTTCKAKLCQMQKHI